LPLEQLALIHYCTAKTLQFLEKHLELVTSQLSSQSSQVPLVNKCQTSGGSSAREMFDRGLQIVVNKRKMYVRDLTIQGKQVMIISVPSRRWKCLAYVWPVSLKMKIAHRNMFGFLEINIFATNIQKHS
jgi:hypothetical protein